MRKLTKAQEAKMLERELAIFEAVRDGRRKDFPKTWKRWTVWLPPKPQELTQMRRGFGLSPRALADRLCMAPSTLKAWEKGTKTPEGSAVTLLRLLMSPSRKTIMKGIESLHGTRYRRS